GPAVTLGAGFQQCTATGTKLGQQVQIALANNGTCQLPASTSASLLIAGITNGATGNFTIVTAADTSSVSTSVTIGAATSPSNVTFSGNLQTAAATTTYTVKFTTSSSGALVGGSSVTATFDPAFTVPASPTVALTGGFASCTIGTVTTSGTNNT